jgi:hypothetical protein
MAVTYNKTVDQLEILTASLRIVGQVSEDGTPTDAQLTNASTALNMMLRAWYADGMPLWNITETSFTPVAGTSSYTIGPSATVNQAKPLKMLQAFIRNTSSSVDTPLTLVTRQEYLMLGNKTSSGRPVQLHYNPEILTGTIRVFPAPDATTASADTIHLIYQSQFDSMTASGSLLDFPIEWQEAVVFGLADRLAFVYGLPIDEKRDLRSKAKEMKMDVLSGGTEEGSFYMQADWRSW